MLKRYVGWGFTDLTSSIMINDKGQGLGLRTIEALVQCFTYIVFYIVSYSQYRPAR